jgi:hypothetical protein
MALHHAECSVSKCLISGVQLCEQGVSRFNLLYVPCTLYSPRSGPTCPITTDLYFPDSVAVLSTGLTFSLIMVTTTVPQRANIVVASAFSLAI